MTTAKAVCESYRVAADRSEHTTATAAVAHAYRVLLSDIDAGGAWLRSTTVQRVTKHEPVKGDIFREFLSSPDEVITGEVVVESPAQIAERAELSRYNAVNGWCTPETVSVG